MYTYYRGDGKKRTVLDLFRTPKIRRINILFMLIWFIAGGVYFSLSLGAPELGGDVFLNFAILNLASIPANFVIQFLVVKFPRRWTLCVLSVLGGIFCAAAAGVPREDPQYSWLVVFFAVLGRSMSGMTTMLLYLYTSESFPTEIRTIGFGAASFATRISAGSSRFLFEASKHGLEFLPFVVLGVANVICGFLALLLCETHQKPLLDTIEEFEGEKMEEDLKSGKTKCSITTKF